MPRDLTQSFLKPKVLELAPCTLALVLPKVTEICPSLTPLWDSGERRASLGDLGNATLHVREKIIAASQVDFVTDHYGVVAEIARTSFTIPNSLSSYNRGNAAMVVKISILPLVMQSGHSHWLTRISFGLYILS